MPPQIVQFSPLPSLISPSFWHKLTELKLDVLKLSDAEVEITGTYGVGRLFKDREATTEKWVGVGASLTVDEESFGKGHASLPFGSSIAKGVVKNYNTIEEFKAAEKAKLLNEAADKATSSPILVCHLDFLTSTIILGMVVNTNDKIDLALEFIPLDHLRRPQEIQILLLVWVPSIHHQAFLVH
ncbi:Autophagy protein 7 [Marasmius tenuissimus]|nr:Autophagy protein 7 [Marasmius tenuissimus]